jgi:hypothetical protein
MLRATPENQYNHQPTPRARRIPIKEWEARRGMIEHLYTEKGASRNDVINELKAQGFPVT